MVPVLTEALLVSITTAVFNYLKEEAGKYVKEQATEYGKQQIEAKVRAWTGRDPNRLAFQVALAQAYTTFARHHPQLTASLFDEHFLQHSAAPFLARCLPWSDPPDPAELAAAWADQLRLKDAARERRIAEVMVAAADFLRFLRAELRAREEFQQDFDSLALDTIAESTAQTVQAVEALQEELARALVQAKKYEVTVRQAQGLVIGDNATVTNIFQTFFDSNHTTMPELYIAPDPVFKRVRLDEFVGRAWLEGDLDAFINDNDRGVWLLEGEAGVGKTSFLAHLVRERKYLHFFAEQASGDINLPRALQSLAVQLVTRFHLEPYHSRDTLPETLSSSPDFLERLLLQASDKELRASERLVIVLDALDEAGTALGGNVLGLPRQVPHGVYLVLSKRPHAVRLNIRPMPHVVDLKAEDPHNHQDIAAYLGRIASIQTINNQLSARGYTTNDFVRILAEKSAGNWMYLHLVVEEIRRGQRVPLDLATLPSELVGYYAEYWGRWREQSEWDSLYAPLLTTLAAAFEPLPRATLTRWSGTKIDDYTLRRLLREQWGAFVYELGDNGHRYRFYHLSLQEFFTGKLETKSFETSIQWLLDELGERAQEAHRRIVGDLRGRCGGDWPQLASDPNDPYVHRHLSAHLRLAGERDALFALVDNRAWYAVQLQEDPSGVAYLSDLAHA